MKPTTSPIHSLALLAALTLSFLAGCEREDSNANIGELHTVKRDVVSERVLVSGSVRPSDVERVKNLVGTGSPPSVMLRAGFKSEYPTLIYLIEEGTEVKKGDLLFEVQSNNLEQIRYEREYYLTWAKTNTIEWQERLAVEEIESEAYMMDAKLDLEFSQSDLVKYEEGDAPLYLQKLKDMVTRATNKAEQAHDEYNQSIKLAANGYINETELEADKLLSQERQMSLELAQSQLALQKQYVYPRQIMKMERQVALNEVRLLNMKLITDSSVAKADRYVDYYVDKVEQYQERLEYIVKMIEDTKIYAPASGTAIYASSNGAGRVVSYKPPAKEGDMIYPSEELIHIISSDRMHLSVKLMEMDLFNVKVGQEVQVTAEALPGVHYTGKVTDIALLATQASVYINPNLRQYEARIDIQGSTEGLKPGMNCIAEIVMDQALDVTTAPVQSIAQRVNPKTGDLQNIIYVMTDRGPEPRAVSIGLRNSIVAQITSGLNVGDQILLTPLAHNDQEIAPAIDPWIMENRDRIRDGITIQPRGKMVGSTSDDRQLQTDPYDLENNSKSALNKRGEPRKSKLAKADAKQERSESLTPTKIKKNKFSAGS